MPISEEIDGAPDAPLSFSTGHQLRIARLSKKPAGHTQRQAAREVFAQTLSKLDVKAASISKLEWRQSKTALGALKRNLSKIGPLLSRYVSGTDMLPIPLSYTDRGDGEKGDEADMGAHVRGRVLYYRRRDILYLLAALVPDAVPEVPTLTFWPAVNLNRRLPGTITDIKQLESGAPLPWIADYLDERIYVHAPKQVQALGITFRVIARTHGALRYFGDPRSPGYDPTRHEHARQLAALVRSFFFQRGRWASFDFDALRTAFYNEYNRKDLNLDASASYLAAALTGEEADGKVPLAGEDDGGKGFDARLFYLVFMPGNFFEAMAARFDYAFDPSKPEATVHRATYPFFLQ